MFLGFLLWKHNFSFASLPWGTATYIPAPVDFDGDGSTDITIYRPSTGDWHFIRSLNGRTDGLHWGVAEDIPIPSVIFYDDSLSALP